jgi:hypothetical protein
LEVPRTRDQPPDGEPVRVQRDGERGHQPPACRLPQCSNRFARDGLRLLG